MSPQQSFEAEWRERFERFAARGGTEARISGWSEHGLRRRMQRVFQVLATHELAGRRILDLGCGTGVYSQALLAREARPLGADYALGMLRRAQQVLGPEAAVPLVAADLLNLPFRSRSFSGLINVGVLQHIAHLDRALGEMARVLDGDGFALIVTLNRHSFHAAASWLVAWPRAWRRGRWRPKRHALRRSAARISRAATRVGFARPRFRGVYLYPKPLRWLETLLDRLDVLRWRGRPLLLPFANAFLVELPKSPTAEA